MKEIYNESREQLEKTISTWIVEQISLIQKEKEKVVIGLPGGRSIVGVLKQLLLVHANLDWHNIHFFFVDERLVTLTHQESNFLLIKNNFFDVLIKEKKITSQNIHPFDIEQYQEDPKGYQKELVAIQNQFDLLILGVGEDGHIASLFPNHLGLQNDSDEFILVNDSPKPPEKRISISKKQLLTSDNIALLFLGEGKKNALSQFKNQEVNYQDCPCKLVTLKQTTKNNQVVVFTDIKLN